MNSCKLWGQTILKDNTYLSRRNDKAIQQLCYQPPVSPSWGAGRDPDQWWLKKCSVCSDSLLPRARLPSESGTPFLQVTDAVTHPGWCLAKALSLVVLCLHHLMPSPCLLSSIFSAKGWLSASLRWAQPYDEVGLVSPTDLCLCFFSESALWRQFQPDLEGTQSLDFKRT